MCLHKRACLSYHLWSDSDQPISPGEVARRTTRHAMRISQGKLPFAHLALQCTEDFGLRACLIRLSWATNFGSHRGMEPRKPYPTDLSDRDWAVIQHLVPAAKPGGRPETYPTREIVEAIFSILRGGCAWRLLPHDVPPVADRLSVLLALADRWHVATDA